ncbi:MAG: toprim domain-containing protein, partial [Oscillospiraceae bacterium]
MFPIIDLRGNVIAFGGRVMQGGGPKYLNSPDTPVFKKSRNLFALNFAKQSAEPYLILAEGYMDVIALHQAGFTTAVATLGTALTSEQARLVAGYVSRVMIAYDSDEAGQKATRRAIGIFSDTGVEVKVLQIEGAKDPDEYIKTFGATRFKLLLAGSAGAVEFELARARSKADVSTEQGKVAFLRD